MKKFTFSLFTMLCSLLIVSSAWAQSGSGGGGSTGGSGSGSGSGSAAPYFGPTTTPCASLSPLCAGLTTEFQLVSLANPYASGTAPAGSASASAPPAFGYCVSGSGSGSGSGGGSIGGGGTGSGSGSAPATAVCVGSGYGALNNGTATTYNSTWFYVDVDQSGPISLTLTSSIAGASLSYAAFGPFARTTAGYNCDALAQRCPEFSEYNSCSTTPSPLSINLPAANTGSKWFILLTHNVGDGRAISVTATEAAGGGSVSSRDCCPTDGPNVKVNAPLCGPGTANLSIISGCDAAVGGTPQWYSSAISSTVLSSATTYTPNISTSTNFYVACKYPNKCVSPRTLVRSVVNPKPTVTLTNQSAYCSNGTATATGAGGTPPYTYTWSNAATTSTLANLAGGAYNVTITDANGCSATGSTSVTAAASTPVASAGTFTAGANYNIYTFTISGGQTPYSFVWNNTGYVRYSVVGNKVTVIWGTGATWSVNIAGSTCPTSTTVSSTSVNAPYINLVGSVTPDDCNTKTVGEGAITVASCGAVSWTGPSGYTGSGNSITALNAGWYTASVTCGGSTFTRKFWVACSRTGRKTDGMIEAFTSYPNPFSTQTTIEFVVAENTEATLLIFGIDGKQITQLFNGAAEAGTVYTLPFEAGQLPNGIYIAKLVTQSGEVKTSRILLHR